MIIGVYSRNPFSSLHMNVVIILAITVREKFEETFSRGGIKSKMLRRKFRQSRTQCSSESSVDNRILQVSFFHRGRFSTHFITRARFVSSGSLCIRHIKQVDALYGRCYYDQISLSWMSSIEPSNGITYIKYVLSLHPTAMSLFLSLSFSLIISNVIISPVLSRRVCVTKFDMLT